MTRKPLDYDRLSRHLKPLYQRMSDTKLLKRCLLTTTQNANENLHGKIWRLASKNTFHGRDRIQFVVTHAVSEFNFGASAVSDLKKELDIPESIMSRVLGIQRMNSRIQLAIKRQEKCTQFRLQQRKDAKDQRARDCSYGPGICGAD